MTEVIILKAHRLALLTDIHKAKCSHRSTRGLKLRLRMVTAMLVGRRYG
jgi:hypothetical protein